jgi:formamidopyrimidine-DNA glycosylase
MPELPEVEVVRRGLERSVSGCRVADVTVAHPRAVRRHLLGAEDFALRLTGRTLGAARRRGKYLWLPLDGDEALLAHLGMSGQLLVRPPGAPDETHLRVRLRLEPGDGEHGVEPRGRTELRFVDQRTFGGLSLTDMTPRDGVPVPVAHIALDPFDPGFDETRFAAALRRRRTGLKRALLDQSLISGVGNIYADEALWRSRLHYERPTETMRRPQVDAVLAAARAVMAEALDQGGTSFDALYVDVDGDSGYFERALDVYGRAGEPCRRCRALIVREPFMNRSSYRCPRCQPRPRRPHL